MNSLKWNETTQEKQTITKHKTHKTKLPFKPT